MKNWHGNDVLFLSNDTTMTESTYNGDQIKAMRFYKEII